MTHSENSQVGVGMQAHANPLPAFNQSAGLEVLCWIGLGLLMLPVLKLLNQWINK